MRFLYINDWQASQWSVHRTVDGPGIVFNFGKRCLAIYFKG